MKWFTRIGTLAKNIIIAKVAKIEITNADCIVQNAVIEIHTHKTKSIIQRRNLQEYD